MLRPGIVGVRGSIPYGHTTTAMHEMSTPAPLPPPNLTQLIVHRLGKKGLIWGLSEILRFCSMTKYREQKGRYIMYLVPGTWYLIASSYSRQATYAGLTRTHAFIPRRRYFNTSRLLGHLGFIPGFQGLSFGVGLGLRIGLGAGLDGSEGCRDGS